MSNLDFEQVGNQPQKQKQSKTPLLDNFSVDLCEAARNNEIDPIVGRKIEIQRLAQILARRRKNNPVLIGEPGVGKSAIVEGLAKQIVEGKCPRILFEKRVVALSLTSLVAGTKYRGQFEERIKALIDEIKSQEDLIVFIDEIHTIIGAGNNAGGMDAANILKPALARGEIQCIGATTMDEYRESIENDGALERRFQKIIVDPPSAAETLEILKTLAPIYGNYHNVSYSNDAIVLAVKLSDRFISDRFFPDKAIDILDEAGAKTQVMADVPEQIVEIEEKIIELNEKKREKVQTQDFEGAAVYRDQEKELKAKLEKEKEIWRSQQKYNRIEVGENKIREVVAMMTGIPVEKCSINDAKKYLELEKTMQNRIVGQDDVLSKVAKSLRRNKTAIANQKKPIGSFLFLGSTGVGKTETAKTIAEEIFGHNSLVRFDMSEFMEKHTVSKLIGAPPGYVGYGDGGELTEKIRRKPFSVVLFDEIEKAHKDVFNILLQILDEGFISDRQGRKVNFRNTIVIMTSNIGVKHAQQFGSGLGFNTPAKASKSETIKHQIQKELKKFFAPEFLNRINDIITFNMLNEDNIKEIVEIQLNRLKKQIEDADYKFQWKKEVVDFIAKEGYEPEYGARPVERAILKHIEDEISEELLRTNAEEGSTIVASYLKKQNKVKIMIK